MYMAIFWARFTDEWDNRVVLMTSSKIALICLLRKASPTPFTLSTKSAFGPPSRLSSSAPSFLFSQEPYWPKFSSTFWWPVLKSPNQSPLCNFFCPCQLRCFPVQVTDDQDEIRLTQCTHLFSGITRNAEIVWPQVWGAESLVLFPWVILALSLVCWPCNQGSSNMASQLLESWRCRKGPSLSFLERKNPFPGPSLKAECPCLLG